MAVSKSTSALKKVAPKKATAGASKKSQVASVSSKKTAAAAKKSAPTKAAVKKPAATPVKKALSKKATPAKAVAAKPRLAPKKSVPPQPVHSVNQTPAVELSNSVLSSEAARASTLLHSYEPTVDEGADPGHIPMDEVLDETDQAQHLQLQEQAAISIRARELNKPETHADFDGKHCVECDEEIPKERLSLRRVRCVECQRFLEAEQERQRRMQG